MKKLAHSKKNPFPVQLILAMITFLFTKREIGRELRDRPTNYLQLKYNFPIKLSLKTSRKTRLRGTVADDLITGNCSVDTTPD